MAKISQIVVGCCSRESFLLYGQHFAISWCGKNQKCLSKLKESLSLYILLHYLRTGELRTQKLKSHLMRTQSLKVLLFKPGVGQYIATHTTLTARDFFLANFYPSGPFTCIFSKISPELFLCWLCLTPVPV